MGIPHCCLCGALWDDDHTCEGQRQIADLKAQIATLTAKLERAMELANEMEHESFCESLRLDREPGYCNCTRGDILRLED